MSDWQYVMFGGVILYGVLLFLHVAANEIMSVNRRLESLEQALRRQAELREEALATVAAETDPAEESVVVVRPAFSSRASG
jgi:hypothetical protein